MKNIFSFLTLLFLCNSCQEAPPPPLLFGKWKVATIYEKGQIKDKSADNIQFSFDQNEEYTFKMGGNALEAGPFYVTGKLLYTTDTISDGRIKKSVTIKELTADSLFLDMNKAGVPMLWKLGREEE